MHGIAAKPIDDRPLSTLDPTMPTKTTPKTTKKAAKATKRRSAPQAEEADGFGDGLVETEAAPTKKKARKKAAKRKRVVEPAAEDAVAEDAVQEDTGDSSGPKKRAVKKRRPAARKRKAEEMAGEGVGAEVISSGGRDNIGRSREEFDFVDDEEEKPASRRSGRGRKNTDDSDDGESSSVSDRSTDDLEDRGVRSGGDESGSTRSSGDSDSRTTDRDDGNRRRGRRGRRGRGRKNDGNENPRQRGRGRNGNPGGQHARGQGRNDRRSVEPVSDTVEGVLELHPKGYGFVRDRSNDYAAQETDPFVSGQMIDKYGLREGVLITGEVGAGHRGQGPRLKTVDTIEGNDPEGYADTPNFDNLTPINPEEQIKLETGPSPLTMRVLDLLCPIGKGQRALIVAPPRSGKTILMQQIADSVSHNHPECHLMVLLIDERPEEVTDMRRSVKGEVIASSIDRELENHVRISQLVLERTKRLAETGKDVFLLLDSITRTARAFNKWTNTGRTGTGGLDVRAMDVPKKLFATARMFDEGGSVTVVGTALVQTGSHMDEAIFQEFKGTGNMELVLSRELADRRIWPAMDISKSGTRREEKLIAPEMLEGITMMRRSLVSLHPAEAMEQLTRTLMKFDTNREFVEKIRNVM